MEYTLKDKLNVTKDFIDDLTEKSWQEIEHIQNQLANLADSAESSQIRKLLNNLLTSYYVFVGGLENFDAASPLSVPPTEILAEPVVIEEPKVLDEPLELPMTPSDEVEISEPFEYFVDFDEPIGEPLTDKDLYDN